MDKTILTKEELNAVLGMAEYWNEVRNRDSGGSTDIVAVLNAELRQVVGELGLKVLRILEEYAKESDTA